MALLIAVCVAAISLRYFLQGSQACLYWGKRMASPEMLAVHPTGFQDAISPPLWVRGVILSSVGLVALLGYAFYSGGTGIGTGFAFVAFVAAVVAARTVVPAADSRKFLSYILTDLVRRAADYEKAGDASRAEAAKAAHRMLFETATAQH